MLKKSKKAFTLIETIFILTIVSILTGMAIYLSSGSTDKAIESSMIIDAQNAIFQQQKSYVNNRVYIEQ